MKSDLELQKIYMQIIREHLITVLIVTMTSKTNWKQPEYPSIADDWIKFDIFLLWNVV